MSAEPESQPASSFDLGTPAFAYFVLSGACLCAGAGQSLLAGALLGAVGGALGALGGYQARTRLVRALRVKDAFVAIPEDLVAIVRVGRVVCGRYRAAGPEGGGSEPGESGASEISMVTVLPSSSVLLPRAATC